MGPNRWASDSSGPLTLGWAIELFLAAKAAEGAAAKTLEWYRMILIRLVRSVGDVRPVDGLAPAELRAWLLDLRATLSPVSVAGYVRTLKVVKRYVALADVDRHTPCDGLPGRPAGGC